MGTQVDEPNENASPSTVGAAFYSLLDAVDSESIANDFEIGTYTAKHNFDNHLKVAIFEGVHPSDSLDELAEKTDTHDELTYMAGSTFSRLTNDRDYRAVVRLFFELLHSPQLYHQRSVQRKRLDWLERAVVATDATNLSVSRSIKIARESDDTEVRRVIQPGQKGLHLNVAARVDGDATHPLGVTITPGVMREPTQFEHLQSDVEVFYWLGEWDADTCSFTADHEDPRRIDYGDFHFTGPSGFVDPRPVGRYCSPSRRTTGPHRTTTMLAGRTTVASRSIFSCAKTETSGSSRLANYDHSVPTDW